MPGVLRRGTRLGKYRLERQLGKGAFSEVFAARDTVEGRRVALKIAFDWVVREFGRDAMEVEARIAGSLSHPNVVALRNADWIDGRFVMACDLARTHVYDYPRAWRSGAVALRIVRDVAAGLAHAHQRRLMHRDVKPENVLVFADGHAAHHRLRRVALHARRVAQLHRGRARWATWRRSRRTGSRRSPPTCSRWG